MNLEGKHSNTGATDTRSDPVCESQVERLAKIADASIRSLSALIFMHDEGLPTEAADYSDLPIVKDKLNPEEKKLFDENSLVGARVLVCALSATNKADDLYEKFALHNGNGDAFRHMYWNFRMASDTDIGPLWAERWGNAHEDGDPRQPQIERMMDLHNNKRGRELAAAKVDDDPRALRAAIRNGSCRIIQQGALVRSNAEGEKP